GSQPIADARSSVRRGSSGRVSRTGDGTIGWTNGSPTRAERAATGRRPSEPDPGNAGAGLMPKVRRPQVRPSERSVVATRTADRLDAVIVGGGVIGLACAWRAAQRGLRVRVLERDAVGSGASGVAAGMLAPVGEATWGEEPMLGLALRSHALWPGFAAELAEASGREVDHLDLGALH